MFYVLKIKYKNKGALDFERKRQKNSSLDGFEFN